MNRAEPKLWESKVWGWSAPVACSPAGASRPLRVDVWGFSRLRIAGFVCWGGVGGSSGGFYCVLIDSETYWAATVSPRAGPPVCRAPRGVGLRPEMLRPHLTLPGAGQGAESRLRCHGLRAPARPPLPPWSPAPHPPYRDPRQPPSLGSASAFASGRGRGGQDAQSACGAGN